MNRSQISVSLLSVMLAMLAGFTGCNNTDSSGRPHESSVSVPESTDNTPVISDNSESLSKSSDSTLESTIVPEQLLSDEQFDIISGLKVQSFVGPDGETVQAADAANVFDTQVNTPNGGSSGFKMGSEVFDDNIFDENGDLVEREIVSTVLRYDFAYIRYCRPLFYVGDMLEDSAQDAQIAALPEVKWFKVKAGDKLDCGLTVKTALYERFPVLSSSPTRDNYIEFDGEITLEGVLYTAKNPNDYLTEPGDLIFAPDPTKISGLPASSSQFDDSHNIYCAMGSGSITFVESDIGCYGWQIGNAGDDGFDKETIFGDDEFALVKVTLKNVIYGGILSYDMPTIYATIVDIERIN